MSPVYAKKFPVFEFVIIFRIMVKNYVNEPFLSSIWLYSFQRKNFN